MAFEVKNKILELEGHKSRLRFTSLQKRQFEVISELYVDTIDLTDDVNRYMTWLGFRGRTPEERADNFFELDGKMKDYGNKLRRKRLFLKADTADKIIDYLRKINRLIDEGGTNDIRTLSDNKIFKIEAMGKIIKLTSEMKVTLDNFAKDLEIEFRTLIEE